MSQKRGGDFPPGQDPRVTDEEKALEHVIREVIREEQSYQDLVGVLESLKNPKERKKTGFASQAEYIQIWQDALKDWKGKPKDRDVVEVFVADHLALLQSETSGAKKTKKERGSTPNKIVEEDDGEARSGRGKKPRNSRERLREDQAPPVASADIVRVVEEALGPHVEAPAVEAVQHVVEELQDKVEETGQPVTLAEVRRIFMEYFPRLAVRKGHQDGEKIYSNLDGNACLFLFREILGFANGTDAEKKYVSDDVVYVKPGTYQKGAINLDTSDGVDGIDFKDESLFVDHHGSNSERQSSAFKILYEDLKRVDLDKQLSPENKLALDRLAQFVTFVDSYTLPPAIEWSDAWNSSHRTLFGLTLAYQNNMPIESLFEFFKHHDIRDAWSYAIDSSTEPYLKKFRELSETWWKEKQRTESFVKEVKERPNAMGFVAETAELGRILVQTQRNSQEKKAALQFAALANGCDGVLVWEPNSGVFFLAVGPEKEVTEELMTKIGEGVLVRRSLIKKMGTERANTLGSMLLSLGVNQEKLPADIKKQVAEVARPRVGNVEAVVTTAGPAAAEGGSEQVLLTEGGLFKPGDLVAFRGLSEFGPSKIEGFVVINGVRSYKLEGDTTKYDEGNLEKFTPPNPEIPQQQPEEQPPQVLMTEGGLFRSGDMVVPEGTEGAEPRRVEGFVVVNGKKYYQIEGMSRNYREDNLEKFTPPTNEPEPEATPELNATPEVNTEIPWWLRDDPEHSRTDSSEREGSGDSSEPEENINEMRDRLRRMALLGEGETRDPETARTSMDGARQNYVSLYKNYLDAKKGSGKWDKIKSKLLFFKKKEAGSVVPPEEILEIKRQMEDARDLYLLSKQEYARSLFHAKVMELGTSGLTPEEITDELNNFGFEIFNKLLIGEEAALQAAKVAEWPAKEKGFLRKGFDWWTKQHWTVRTLMTTGILTGALFAGGYVGVGAVGGYAASRLARSLSSAGLGQLAGWGVDKFLGRQTSNYVNERVGTTMREVAEKGVNPQDTFDYLWHNQIKAFKQKQKEDKFRLYAKVVAMMAVGVGASYGLNMYFGGTEAAEQATAAAAAKKAIEQSNVNTGGGVVAGAETPGVTGANTETPTSSIFPEVRIAELEKKFQAIIEESQKKHQGLMEVIKQKIQAIETENKLDQLATLKRGEGVISVFRRQLEAMPAKFGFTGDPENLKAVHAWAEKQATQLSIKAGYWDPSTGDQKWAKWDPRALMRFNVEGDTQSGLSVSETGTEGRQYIHHGEVTKPLPAGLEDKPQVGKVLNAVDKAVRQADIQPAYINEPTIFGESDKPFPLKVPSAEAVPTASDFPKAVQPYAGYLENKLRVAQDLVDQYKDNPTLGPVARQALEQVKSDTATFVENVDQNKLASYQNFSPENANVAEELRQAMEKTVDGKIVIPEVLAGQRIPIENNFGLKFETSGGRLMPVIDAPRAEMSRVFESHSGMKTDGWLDDDVTENLADRNKALGAVPQNNLTKMDFLIRALDKLKAVGGSNEAVQVVKGTVDSLATSISETIDKKPNEVFTRAFLNRFK